MTEAEEQAKALIGELSSQLQDMAEARTRLGVSLRLAQSRIQAMEAEIAELKARPKRRASKRQ